MTRKHQGEREVTPWTLSIITHHMKARLSRKSYTRRSHRHSAAPDSTRNPGRSMRVGFIDLLQTISVWGIHRHSNRHTPQGSASCVQSFDDSLIVQFALRIAFRCVLHRCRNLDIRCWNCLVIDYMIIMSWLTDFDRVLWLMVLYLQWLQKPKAFTSLRKHKGIMIVVKYHETYKEYWRKDVYTNFTFPLRKVFLVLVLW